MVARLALAIALGGMLGYLALAGRPYPPGTPHRPDAGGAPPARGERPPALAWDATPDGEPAGDAEGWTTRDGVGAPAFSVAPEPLAPGEAAPPERLSEAERKNREAVARAEDGDMTAAAVLLREALRLEPTQPLYAKNLQAVLINTGFAEIEAERFERAAGAFVEALRHGDRAEIRRGLGYAYYRLGNLDLARTSLERALEQDTGDVETFVTLGRIYLERHDQARALAMFEQALAAGAERPGLEETVARLRRDAAAEQGFHALASSHFVLKFEGRENTEAGRLVLNALEDAYRRVGARFAYYPLERQEVVLYGDEAFRAVTNSPHWSGGVYDGRIKLPVGGLERGSERLSRTLRHEYAHAAIVTLSRGKAPVWLNEGLAQLAEEGGDEGRAARLRAAVANGTLIPLAELEGGFTGYDRTQASLAYAEAYYAADYLVRQKGAYNVRRLLEALASAESIDAAFRQALSLPYAEFDRRFLAEVARHVQ